MSIVVGGVLPISEDKKQARTSQLLELADKGMISLYMRFPRNRSGFLIDESDYLIIDSEAVYIEKKPNNESCLRTFLFDEDPTLRYLLYDFKSYTCYKKALLYEKGKNEPLLLSIAEIRTVEHQSGQSIESLSHSQIQSFVNFFQKPN